MSFIDDVTATYCERAKFSNVEKQRISLYFKMTIAENLRKNVFDLLSRNNSFECLRYDYLLYFNVYVTDLLLLPLF